MLSQTYLPRHDQNRMQHEGDVARARNYYFHGAPENLRSLLRHRYEWMNQFIGPDQRGVEIGCGTGISKEFIRAADYRLSDVSDYPWLDYPGVDALATPFPDAAYDFVVCSNMIHHVAQPLVLLGELNRILKPGGRVLVQEVGGSLLMRLLLRVMRHEGYSYEPNVFDPQAICNDPADPWSANCVIPNLLFDDRAAFERRVPEFQILHRSFSECLAMMNSGGVIAKTACLPLPSWAQFVVRGIDAALTKLAPRIFAMQRQIVLEKRVSPSPSAAATGNVSAAA